MPNLFQILLHRSPSLRKVIVGIYKHSRSTVLFGPSRCVNVDESFAQALAVAPSADREALWTMASGWREPCSIADSVHVLSGRENNFFGQRVALLAHWDSNSCVAPYVWYYAEKLAALGFTVVLASGVPLSASSLPGGTSPFAAIVWRDCPGYDFTSWKAGLEAFPSLYEAEELFITNDSIFAPIGDFQPIFDGMRPVPCDVWGLVETQVTIPHLQSYGVLFRRKALQHPALAEFFARIPASNDRILALKHEQRLAVWLYQHGLSIGAWLPARSLPWPWFNPLHRTWRQMLALGLPLMKRDMFLHRTGTSFPQGWQHEAERQGYPPDLISDYLSCIDHTRSVCPVSTQSMTNTEP